VTATDPAAVAALAVEVAADLVIVGPEAPLVAGVADAVRAKGIACFGPSAAAAQLEGSKAFAKDVMAAAGVPTGLAYACTTEAEVRRALDDFGPPYVVKNDGLAAGKGVVVTSALDEALAHAADCGRVVIEQYLSGPEVSLFVVTDGTAAVPLMPAQDFKRVGDDDAGPNTGGMVRTRRCRGRRRTWSSRSCGRRSSRRWPRCASAASRSPACSMPGSR